MRILIAGLGGIGQRHLRNLRARLGAGAEINAVDPRRNIPVLTDQLQVEAGITLEKKYDLHIFSDLEPALAWKPDAVFVCNPTSLHVPTALQAAQAGCHLFIEKPLSHNLEQVEALISLVKRQGLMAVVGYQMRFHPCLLRLYTLVQEKTVGRILSVRAEIGEYLPGWHGYEDYRQMYASHQDLGGGVILSQIHEMDYLYWLFGLPCSVYALGGHLSRLEVDVEDTADILMNFTMDGQSVPVSLHEDYLQRPSYRTCEVIGDQGKILVNLAALSLEEFDGEGKQVEAASYAGFQRNQMFVDELNHFLSSLRGSTGSSTGQGTSASPLPMGEDRVRTSPLVSVREAAYSLRMALAAKESLMTGKVVNLTR
jgi:predicted dehydrogenase